MVRSSILVEDVPRGSFELFVDVIIIGYSALVQIPGNIALGYIYLCNIILLYNNKVANVPQEQHDGCHMWNKTWGTFREHQR
jgi:hypothetical protein